MILPVNWAFRTIWDNVIAMFLDAKSKSATHLLKVRAFWMKRASNALSPIESELRLTHPTLIRTTRVQDKAELLDYINEDQLADFCGGKKSYTFVPPQEEE